MKKPKKIRNIKFPANDGSWNQVNLFLNKHRLFELSTIAPVEFCIKLDDCVPYEWSYWNKLTNYDCLIIHKGMLECFKNNYLNHISQFYDFVFGNDVFNVFILKSLNNIKLSGDNNHRLNHFELKAPFEKQRDESVVINKILLVTANNNGNIGDDAITHASFDMLQAIFPNAQILVDKAPAVKQTISNVDLVVLGGGGIFYDNCFYNAQNYCQYFLYAHEAGVKSCAIAIGALGRRTILGNELFKQALDLTEFIVVRDQQSQLALTTMVSTTTPVILKQDVAFTLQSDGNTIIPRKTNKPLLLFSLLDAKGKPNMLVYQNAQFDCMQFLVEHFEVKLLLQSTDDLAFYTELSNKFNLEIIKIAFRSVKQIVNIYQQCDLVVTGRLHGYIFASLAQVPTISVVVKRDNSKLYRLIIDSIPSGQIGLIDKSVYTINKIKDKIAIFNKYPKSLIVDYLEVKDCQKQSNQTSDVIRKYLLN